ncbi:hypothetical protein L1049_017286 [Liquidambar formosana]|uniref:Uncharacterized protein n=1 Tax=Liquidambar formosana TaxID=63359 RepID=A0AAP0X3M3_LIQFO
MGGNNRQRKSSSFLSIFNIFKACCSHGRDDTWDEGGNVRRICPSDEDRGRWIAEPGIDWKASAFIARFYETRVSEGQTVAV